MLWNMELWDYNLLLWDKQCSQEHCGYPLLFSKSQKNLISAQLSNLKVHTVNYIWKQSFLYSVIHVFKAAYINKAMKVSAMKYFYYRLKINLCPEGRVSCQFCWDFIRNLNPNDCLRLWGKYTYWLTLYAWSVFFEEPD